MKQRQLTQEEIDLTPVGFKHYAFMVNGSLTYLDQDNGKMMTKGMVERGENSISTGSYFSESEIQPIPRKAFDIESFQSPDMHDMEQPYIGIDDGVITVDGKIDKHWSIAIAKALGVTAEDFK